MMERDELDRIAWIGGEVPRDLSYSDTLYYLMTRALYEFYRTRQPDAEKGRREKAKIADAVRKFQAAQDSAQRYGALMRDTGAARAAYRLARKDMGAETPLYLPAQVVAVIAAADRLVEIMDGMKIEENSDGMV
ncbi:MAG: hypothetical protein J6S60_00555 [Oscillospiraceae bacterium]|nr:hypothetical protein [Oscillospiraceae bacterium]